jgi:hypothetical protein
MSWKNEPCPHCGKMFADRNSVFQHLKAKHGGKGKAAYRPEREPSMGEIVAEAQMNRAMGIPNEDWIETILEGFE